MVAHDVARLVGVMDAQDVAGLEGMMVTHDDELDSCCILTMPLCVLSHCSVIHRGLVCLYEVEQMCHVTVRAALSQTTHDQGSCYCCWLQLVFLTISLCVCSHIDFVCIEVWYNCLHRGL